jgi:predicted  nucleic acid-binding Zn-ribbon protein
MAKKTEAKADKNEAVKATKDVNSKESNKPEVAENKAEETTKKATSRRAAADKKETKEIAPAEEFSVDVASLKNKDVKDFTVEEKLYMLYKLQTVVSEIDKIKTLRGELPLEVQDLEDEIAGLKTRLDKYQAEIQELDENVSAQKNKISESKLLVEKYKGQLDQVRNNREFDNLSKEVEFQELEVEFSEKKIKEFNVAIKQKKESISGSKEILDGRKIDLEQKKKELQEIVAETRQEEDKLREKAKAIEEKIEPRLLNAFKRIRKGARNGLAVVNIERDACGGCFNKIPPQKQLDIKLHKKIIVCEYCGRVMIDPELANAKEV